PSFTPFDFDPFGRLGNVGRNSFYGPMFDNWDFIVAKKTRISERFLIETRVEMYNLFNQTNFGQPGNLIQNPDSFGTSASQIGRSDGTTGSRQFQLGLKLTF